MGIDPNLAAMAAWALGGGLAALAGVLLAALTNLDPYNLPLQVLPAFVAALIGGLESLPGGLLGSIVTGFSFGLAPALSNVPGVGNVMRLSGSPQLILAAVAMVVMGLRGRRIAGVEAAESGLSSGGLVRTTAPKRGITPGLVAAVAFLMLFPFVVGDSILGDALLAFEFAMIAISLVVLIGWVGQISLAQASFVGIGAFITAMAARGWDLQFPINVVVGMVAAAVGAVLLGVIALRVRGLYLAVATLIFAWMADTFLFRSPWLGAGGGSSTIPDQQIGSPGTFASFDLTHRRPLYYVMLAVLVVVITALANLRETRTGRAFFAVRGSEMAAASLGIDVVRFKLLAFAVSGALAGLGGGLLMVEQRTVVPTQFLFTFSLQFLAIAVIGGLGSLGGAVASGVLFAALNELFFQVSALAGWLEVVSAGLLAAALLSYPGGLAAAHASAMRLVDRLRTARAGDDERTEPAPARRLATRAAPLLEKARRLVVRAARPLARVRPGRRK
ncbi:MAG: branched-chain amino acid ABC transporter permease, partial [Actinomycetota bacterium]